MEDVNYQRGWVDVDNIADEIEERTDFDEKIDAATQQAAAMAELARARADDIPAFAGFRDAADLTTLLANSTWRYDATGAAQVVTGDVFRTRKEGFSYVAAASGASEISLSAPTGSHLQTAGGVKLFVQPGPRGLNAAAFGAVGDNTTDATVALQRFLAATNTSAAENAFIPPGKYKTTAPLVIPDRVTKNLILSAYGAHIMASGFSDYALKAETAVYNGESLRIEGLIINGNYQTKGLRILFIQEWLLRSVQIIGCFVGLRIEDTYYGMMEGECVIRNCLTMIECGNRGASGEINTIDFGTARLNFSGSRNSFIAQNEGESTEDYHARVPTIGVRLQNMLYAPKFYGLTMEGVDYGFYGWEHGFGVSGSNGSLFKIDQCYFEAIHVSPISIRTRVGWQTTAAIRVEIANCHFANDAPPCQIGMGYWRIFGNGPNIKLNVFNSGVGVPADASQRCTIDTDVPKSSIWLEDPHSNTTILRNRALQSTVNDRKYNAWGSTDTFPKNANALPSFEDTGGVMLPAVIRADFKAARYSDVLNVTSKPVTFARAPSPSGQRPNGPVIKGDNGFYYMLETADGSSLRLRRVYNIQRLETPVLGYEAVELYQNSALAAGSYECVDIPATVIKNSEGKWVDANGAIVLGTTAEIIAQTYGATFGGNIKWNMQINSGLNWRADHWAWGPDWYGENTAIRAIGTAAQRPSTPAVFYMVYYATDTTTYTKWDGSAWSAFTPLF